MENHSTTQSDLTMQFKLSSSNTICRICLSALSSIDGIFSDECIDCRNYISSHIRYRRSNSIISRQDRDSIRSALTIFNSVEESKNNIIRLFSNIKNAVGDNRKKLEAALDSTILMKIGEVNDFKNKVNSQMLELKHSAEKQIHLIEIPKDDTVGVILNKLSGSEKIGQLGVFNYRIDSDKIVEKIKKSSISAPNKIEVFLSEPDIKFFIPRPLFKMKKFKLFTKTYEDVPILNVKEFDWPEKGNLIEYQENLFLYAGEVGFFSTKGVWNIDTSLENINAILVGNFPGREDHTLEYLNQKIYALGGNSKKIQYFSLDTQNGWETLLNLPEEIGYSHSVRIGETAFLVGAKSKNLYKYHINENKLETDNYQSFVKGQNRFIFDLDGKELIFTNSQVLWKKEIICQTGENFSGLRCAGKGKIVYSYLYFVTYNQRFEQNVWRLCLRSFLLVRF